MDDDIRNRYRRDYTAEPIRTVAHPPAIPQPQEISVKSRRFAAKKPLKTAVISLVVLLVIAGFAALFNQKHPKPATIPTSQPAKKAQAIKAPVITKAGPAPTPAAVTKQIGTTPYYPAALPTTFHSNNDTQLIGKNTIYYSYSDDKGNQYYVTQQPIPTNFNYAAFKDSLTSVEEFNVPIGAAVIGVNGSELLGGIRTTNNLWILVGASSANIVTQLKTLMNSLQPVST